MGTDLLKNSVVYTIIGFLPLSFAFIFTPIYFKYMNEGEYGMLSLFVLYSGVIAKIYDLGISQAFIYLYWDVYKEKEKLKTLMSNTLGLLIILQLVLLTLGFLFGEKFLTLIVKSNEAFTFSPYFILTLVFALFMVYFELIQQFFRNEGNLRSYSILGIGTLIFLTIGTLTGVVFLDLKALGAILGRSVGYGVVVTVFLFILIRKFGVSLNLERSKTLLKFGFPLFINAILGAVAYGIDKILIERLDSLETLGIYSLAVVIVSIIEIWFNSINNALTPTLYKIINESLNNKVNEIQGLSHFIILSVVLVVVAVIALTIPVLHLFIPSNFHNAAVFVPILASSFIWRVLTTLESLALYREKKTKFFLFNQSSLLFFTLIFGFIGYTIYGIIGIAYGVYVSKVIEYLVMKMIVRKVKVIPFRIRPFLILALCIGASTFVCSSNAFQMNSQSTAYLLPLIVFILYSALFLKSQLNNIAFVIKNRKILF